MKYSVSITGWGGDALEFLKDKDNSFLIFFDENAPEELAEIAVLHTKSELLADPGPGDMLIICEKVYTITAVGDEALQTLRSMGHCTFYFKGSDLPERPGCIMLEGAPPDPEDIIPGGMLEIY